MKYNMEGKVAIVTGGYKGIGKGIVSEFLAANATVIFTGRNEEGGKATEEEFKNLGNVEFVKGDVASEEDVIKVIDYVAEKYGRIDYVVNNAGYTHAYTELLHECTYDEYKKAFDTNVGGIFLMMKYAIIKMMEKGEGGSIVNISSCASITNMVYHAIYAASKNAVNRLTTCAAKEYGNQGIRVNAILPGTIETESYAPTRISHPGYLEALEKDIPLKRFGKPSEIGKAAVWLCSEDAAYVTGAVFNIDGALFI